MLSKEMRETQTAFELPAREMLAFFNWANVLVGQSNANLQIGLVNVQGGQANLAIITVGQA